MIVNLDKIYQCECMEVENLYLDAEEAARALGVSVATLYAYVSRKQIRSEKVAGTKARRYWKADIDRLRGREPQSAKDPGETSISTQTAITLITDGGLYFRGKSAMELAQSSTLESLAAFLWEADEGDLFGGMVQDVPAAVASMLTPMSEFGLYERCLALFPLIERFNPRSYDLSKDGYARTGADVLRWFAALLTKSRGPKIGLIHKNVAKELKAPAGYDEVIRALLVLSADHEFDPITYAVRAVANVGVTPFQAVITGMIASQGQRFHAERYGSSLRFLHEILSEKDGSAAVVARLRSGQSLSGFSAPRLPQDPRAAAMMEVMGAVMAKDAQFQRLKQAQQTALDAASTHMDFILTALFVGHRLGLSADELSISGLGRIVGWIAHAMEQYQHNDLVRPRALYAGRLP
jgi:citrate synthase